MTNSPWLIVMALQMLGTMILWFGWYGFNSGSALLADNSGNGDALATRAGTNTTLAGGAAGISALFMNYLVIQRLQGEGRYDLLVTMNGVLAGLVSITSGCALVEPWAAVIAGAIAGPVYLLSSWGLLRLRLDDAVDAIPVHMASGIWGMIATGLFAQPERLMVAYSRNDHPGLFYGADFTLVGSQIIGVMFILTWTCGVMLPFFVFLERTGHFRADAMAEVSGLDKVYFGDVQHAGGDDELSPEMLSKLTKQLDQQLHHRRGHHSSDKATVDTSVLTPDVQDTSDKLSKNV